MVRHSKNNTASGVFTYAERQMVDYGTKSKRLGSDSKRVFDACYLCLNTARVPMVCSNGHLSCKECVLSGMLEQKKAIKRAQAEYDEYKRKERTEEKQRERRREEVLVQRKAKRSADGDAAEEQGGEKKAKLLIEDKSSADGTAAVAAQVFSRAKGKETADVDAEESDKRPKLPSFWIPSLAPEAKNVPTDPRKQSVQCYASSPPHPLKPKHLVEVKFRSGSNGEKLCPSCDKSLSNSTKIDVLKPCGHAICHRCVSNFVMPAGACFVCQKKVRGDEDAIRLDSEGTGFTGGGGKMVATRYDSALQA
ncbi:hypothetical protein GQ54DRAFT_260112 [Martensiomyces pterosporus]|nr:hypothetical protein GQ54DRAFT_260112 [Martensiomyces pterosporus]